jgi:hypothetical protein
MMNKFSTRCFLACLAACATASIAETARAVDATPDVEVGIPDVIYLKTFSKFVCKFPPTSLITTVPTVGIVTGTNATITTSTSVGSISGDAAIGVVSPFTNVTSQKCEAQNAFAVWGTGGTNGNVKVDTSVDTGTLTHTVGSQTMALSTAKFVENGTGGVLGVSSTFPAPGLSTPYKGNLRLDLDITNATRSGTYTGGKIKISAVSD